MADFDRSSSGHQAHIAIPVAPQRDAPRSNSVQVNQLLYGEMLHISEMHEDFAFGYSPQSDYSGWVEKTSLNFSPLNATHKVKSKATHVFAKPSIKSKTMMRLPRLAQAAVTRQVGEFFALAQGGFVSQSCFEIHNNQPLQCKPLATAKSYLGTPYLWGGRSDLGLDCSGLVQISLAFHGLACPRDSGPQASLGQPLDLDPSCWQAGDLLFWDGHVAFVGENVSLVHATAFTMQVLEEPLIPALERIQAITPLRHAKRLSFNPRSI